MKPHLSSLPTEPVEKVENRHVHGTGSTQQIQVSAPLSSNVPFLEVQVQNHA